MTFKQVKHYLKNNDHDIDGEDIGKVTLGSLRNTFQNQDDELDVLR